MEAVGVVVDAVLTAAPGTGSDPVPGRGQLRVWALSAGVALTAAVLDLTVVRHMGPVDAPLHIPWWAFAVLFVLAEWWRVCLYFRSSAHSFSLSEMPLVLGLFLTAPSGLVLARLIGAVVAMGL